MKPVERFLQEIDQAWSTSAQRILLPLIGSAALMLQTDYHRGTKDSDVLETDALTPAIRRRLLQVAGQDSPLCRRHRMYVDIVMRGLPFRRQVARYSPLDALNLQLQHFDVEVMSILDVVVSKLVRFSANDRDDIDAMVSRDLVVHADFVACFHEAMAHKQDLTIGEFENLVKNLNTVEREMLDVPVSNVEEPSWVR